MTFTSSRDFLHTHTFTLTLTSLASPPAGGIQRETSEAEGHTHLVTLSEDELGAIDQGRIVTRRTSDHLGHGHTFDFFTGLGQPPR